MNYRRDGKSRRLSDVVSANTAEIGDVSFIAQNGCVIHRIMDIATEGRKGEPMNKNTVENCCKNCEYSGNYDGWNEFICKYYNGMIRGEQYDCEGFKPEGELNE